MKPINYAQINTLKRGTDLKFEWSFYDHYGLK